MPDQLTYLALLIGWAAPVIALHWAIGAPELRAKWRLLAVAVIVPTVYLSLADAVAIGQGVWSISEELTVGWRVGSLVFEEAIFFFLTNVLVAQSIILFLAPSARRRADRMARAVVWRVVRVMPARRGRSSPMDSSDAWRPLTAIDRDHGARLWSCRRASYTLCKIYALFVSAVGYMQPKTVIIGGGVGGLATAIRLAGAGHRVTLFERNPTVGGRANELRVDGYRFDTGPTLLLMPDVYRELFASVGRQVEDYVTLMPMEPNYRVHLTGGRSFDASRDLHRMAAEVDQIEPGAGARITPFLEDAGYKYRIAREKFVERNFQHLFEFITPANLYYLLRTEALAKLFRRTGRYFRDEYLRLAFTFQTMYLGISPLDAPAIYALLPYTELTEGIWYPRGGVYRLIEAMRQLAEELGAEVRTSAEVTGLQFAGNQVTGVTLAGGETVDADVVVANPDLPAAYHRFVPERLRPDFPNRRLRRMRYTASAYMLYLGIDRVYEQLRHHNVYFSGDFQSNFDAIFRTCRLPDEPSLYIAAPGRTDPTVAPPGHDALMVLVPVPHLARNGVDWDKEEPAFREHLYHQLERLGLTDLRRHIRVERRFTPVDWRDTYSLTLGAAFGLSHDFLQVGYLRPSNRAKKIRNLYFVGASTVPGTGVPMVIIGSRLVAERILREQGGHRRADDHA